MKFSDNFQYNRKIVNYIKELSKIELCLKNDPKIRGLGLWLRKNAIVKTVTYSNQIEGNRLNEKQVETIIQGKKVVGNSKDIQETKNLAEAYELIEQLSAQEEILTKHDLFNLHKILCKKTFPTDHELGKIRSIDLSAGDPITGEIEYQPPSQMECVDLMEDFFKWLEKQLHNEDFEPYITAALAHYYLVTIHPFVDGNGRISRLLQNYLLRKGNLHFSTYIPVETAIKRNQQKYYDSLVITRKENDSNYFIEFILSMFIEEGNELLQSVSKIKKEVISKLDIQENEVLLLLNSLKSIRSKDVINKLGVSKATATRIFDRLLKQKKIRRIGQGAHSYYTLM